VGLGRAKWACKENGDGDKQVSCIVEDMSVAHLKVLKQDASGRHDKVSRLTEAEPSAR
jgi:hypothetical protein